MSFKKTTIKYRNRQGDLVTRTIKINTIVIKRRTMEAEVYVELWKSDKAESDGFEPEFMDLRVPLNFNDNSIQTLFREINKMVWNSILDTKFVPDSNKSGDKVKTELKSLRDLSAEVIDE